MSNSYIVEFSVCDDPEEKPRAVTGAIVNSTYCAVRDKWVLLVNGDDRKLYTLTSDDLGLVCDWEVSSDVIFAAGSGDDESEEGDDE